MERSSLCQCLWEFRAIKPGVKMDHVCSPKVAVVLMFFQEKYLCKKSGGEGGIAACFMMLAVSNWLLGKTFL